MSATESVPPSSAGGVASDAPDAALSAEVGVRVKAHPGLCNGVGNCHRWAPEIYTLDADGYIDVHLLDVPPELAAQARLGAQVCPEQAITIIEAKKEREP